MSDVTNYNFGTEPSIIKVIGVGGGGGNAVAHMYLHGIKGVDFYICNTDIQALDLSPVPNKVQIGKTLTQGLGAGANPERGRSAAIESKDEIKTILGDNTKMLFITAGMGGGTGTGAAPVIAEIAQSLGVLTVGIVTAPFSFEGRPKRVRAQEGVNALREHCDTVLVILNDRLRDVYGKASMREAFRQADNVLLKGAKSIAEIITVSGTINVDFEDVRTVMQGAGAAVMGSSTAEGENRARRAAEGAISSPLLNNTNIFGAKYILLSIVIGNEEEFQMDELEEVTDYVQEQAGDDAEIIFGQATDETLGDSISVTIIATGFEHSEDLPPERPERKVYDLTSNKRIKNRIEVKDYEKKDFFEDKEDKESTQPNRVETQVQRQQPVEETKPIYTEPKKTDKIIFSLEDDYFNEEDSKKKITNQAPQNTPAVSAYGYMNQHSQNVQNQQNTNQQNANSSSSQNSQNNGNYSSQNTVTQYQVAEKRVEQQKPVVPTKSLSDLSDEELQERRDVPAYLRRNVKLKEMPHSSESSSSRYKVDEDNELLGGNRFLHDNVD
ncbi:MAG: cell division protein FtsZ [Flexibacter sp. CG_4_10_14_3_um_filter_32_15]|nr:MAG: cell division protein FtsZ [Flexibacter sp. CG_4_10_14_3_um_filter_32_15]